MKIVKIVFISRRSLVYFENLNFHYNCFDSRFHTFSDEFIEFVGDEKRCHHVVKKDLLIETSRKISGIDKFLMNGVESKQRDIMSQKMTCHFLFMIFKQKWIVVARKNRYLFMVVPISIFLLFNVGSQQMHIRLGG